MMDWQSFWHGLYIGGMSIGAIYFALLGRHPRGLPRLEYFVATFIPLLSPRHCCSCRCPGPPCTTTSQRIGG